MNTIIISGPDALPSHSPKAHANCRVSLSDVLPFELEFKQYSLNHAHLTLTVLC